MTKTTGTRTAPRALRASDVESAFKATALVTNRRQLVPRAHRPGSDNRRSAKVLDSGARIEDRVVAALVRKCRVDAWRRPGIRVLRTSGVHYVPDAAGYLPELDARLVPEVTPQVADRPDYNVLFEVKGQRTTGSAKNKISGAIVDLAHASDVLGVPAVMVLDIPVVSEKQIRAWKHDGRVHSVVVLTKDELQRDLLITEVIRVAKERRRLQRRIGVRGGYTATKRPPLFEKGLAIRISARRHASLLG